VKKRILLVGDHPYAFTGNGNMMRSLLSTIDYTKFEITCFGVTVPTKSQFVIASTPINLPYLLIPFTPHNDEVYGGSQIVELIKKFKYDAMVIVGLDIWRYGYIFRQLDDLRSAFKIKLSGIFPYDLLKLRTDWCEWFNFFDVPCVYSEYGYNTLKDVVKNLHYFRPPLADSDLYKKYSPEVRNAARKKILGGEENDDIFIFGFIGKNQVRKDLPRFLKVFGEIVNPNNNNTYIYLHTNFNGVFNIHSLVQDYDIRTGSISVNKQDFTLPESEMAEIYNGIDCLVNCSLQEGLSWTILNAMLCGTPVIASKNTAHIELFENDKYLVECDELTYLHSMTAFGQSHIETKACNINSLADAMLNMSYESKEIREEIGRSNIKTAQNWLCGVSDINNLLSELAPNTIETVASKENAILFAQHSSAGDVLMTTQCLKGIKERHPNIPLHYMTQPVFMDIVEGNKYIDKIVSWDKNKFGQYDIVYNPHGEKILPGGWNNLDFTLYSMYPYFCKVDPDEISITISKPEFFDDDTLATARPMCIVHTTGGQPQYRMYKHLDIALKGLALFVIQIGSENDWPVRSAELDLRGKLTWRETAWVMSMADIAVCVDSFPMHLAGALGINTVAIFGPAPARVTQPRMQHGARSIILEPDRLDVCPITSGCWGQQDKNPCMTPCINTIHPVKVKKAIQNLLGE
jgi:glycosyltransferase involved in cell wall biosynthesis